MPSEQPSVDDDARFPSGPWTGFFLQKSLPGRHRMELHLTFLNGVMTGEGRDWVGSFTVTGHYDPADGKCNWHKKYVGKHDVYYQGYNEGKGIWGCWEITALASLGSLARGGFHIWPEGMGDPTLEVLAAEAELPNSEEQLVESGATISRGDLP